MNKLILLLIAFYFHTVSQAQVRPLYLVADTIEAYSSSSKGATLRIKNNTRTRAGSFLQNYDGNGTTRFSWAIDSAYVSGGVLHLLRSNHDTIRATLGSGGGGSMVYPGAGIAVSTGSAWATSITNNSANWNTAYSWGNPAGVYLPLSGGTMTGQLIQLQAGSTGVSPIKMNGAWYSGGSSSSTKPMFLIEPVGTSSGNWSTSGTGFGINAAMGFVGNFIDNKIANSTKFKIDYTGKITAANLTLTGITYHASKYILHTDASGNISYADSLASGSGSVTSVGLSLPGELTVTGSPVTSSGTLTGSWTNQSAYKVFSRGSSTGMPAFNSLDTNYISGFSTKVRPLFSAGTGIDFNNTTGVITSTVNPLPAITAWQVTYGNATNDGITSSPYFTADLGGTLPVVQIGTASGDVLQLNKEKIYQMGDIGQTTNGNKIYIDDINSLMYVEDKTQTTKFGINTVPEFTLDVKGSTSLRGRNYFRSYDIDDADYTIGDNDYLITGRTMSSDRTLTLPAGEANRFLKFVTSNDTYYFKFDIGIKNHKGQDITAGSQVPFFSFELYFDNDSGKWRMTYGN